MKLPAYALAFTLVHSGLLFCADQHWSLKPVNPTQPPLLGDSAWGANPVDRFVYSKLNANRLEPSPPADRRQLLRRLTIDLTGLPPTYQEVTAFLTDSSPNAYERLVDRLLASPAYGERWAQHWLDVVRYADSDGFEYDDPRPSAWRYRDWVINALDQDYPYNLFVRDQIAADLLDPQQATDHIPTGLHRLGPVRKNAGTQDEKRNRQEQLVQMTDAVGFAFLGLTLGCAKCHDHKFDPISQSEYYGLQAFFAGTVPDDIPIASKEVIEQHRLELEVWRSATQELEAQLDQRKQQDPTDDSIAKLEDQLKTLRQQEPQPLETVMGVRESDTTPPTYILARGDPHFELDTVDPHFPSSIEQQKSVRSKKRRMQLAEWLASNHHPLTARVMVNRIWQHHFGQGLVSTPSDFGRLGTPPSHPKLLDWLTHQFTSHDWSIKHLQRILVTSSTYRQSSAERLSAPHDDLQNRLLWRMPNRRLDAESIRDAALFVAGDLNRARHGPGVRMKYSDDIRRMQYKGEWVASEDPVQQSRRSIYRFFKRNLQSPLFTAFDAPDTLVSCSQRSVSHHAGQALALLNGSTLNTQSTRLATRIFDESHSRDFIDRAYQLVLARDPTRQERLAGQKFLRRQQALIAENGGDRMQEIRTGLADYCLVLMNLDAFLYY